MENRTYWIIKNWVLLIAIGIIFTLEPLLYWAYYDYHLSQEIPKDTIWFLRAIGYCGLVIIFVGISFYIISLYYRYFKPLKQLLYPHYRPQFAYGNYPYPQSQIGHCTDCKRAILMDSNFCPYCGIDQQPQASRCSNCKRQIPNDSIFCPYCSQPLVYIKQQPNKSN